MNRRLGVALIAALLATGCAHDATRTAEPVASVDEHKLAIEDQVAFFVNHARSGDLAAVREGLDRGLPVNGKDSVGQSALIAAVSQGQIDTIKLLLKRGADPNQADDAGWTSLHFAAYFGVGTAVLRDLLAHGARVDARNDRGITPLYLASVAGHDLQVKLLLERGADRNIASTTGYTPLRAAQAKGFTRVIELLDAKS